MWRGCGRVLPVLTLGGALMFAPLPVQAQKMATMPGASAGIPTPTTPYSNPYANPFLNPYMTQQAMPGDVALYYFLSAQQQNGGIGSGRLSGSRPGPSPPQAAAETDPRRITDQPGAAAARYFNQPYRTPATTSQYFNRSVRSNRFNRR